MQCPLCHSQTSSSFRHQTRVEVFAQCPQCDLIFVIVEKQLNWQEQKQRYDQHQNSLNQPGYVQYFEQLLSPLMPELKQRKISRGLDWGSGPTPALAELLLQRGVHLDIYDPIYQTDMSDLLAKYDLITCTEVVEHFYAPGDSFAEIFQRLSSGAFFAGLTQFHQGAEHFAKWWYAKDTTHVAFYSPKTFHWLAQRFGCRILYLQSPVFILEVKAETSIR